MYIPMERARVPLPDVDLDLFAGFSLENDGTDMGQSAKPLSRRVSASERIVDSASLVLRRHRS